MFRILFVILAAAVITFSSILLGHYLTVKVAEAEAILNTAEPADKLITSRPQLPETPASSREISAAGLELRNYHTEDAVVAAVNNLAEHYDTLLFDLSDGEGNLLYTSPALCERTRIAVPDEEDNRSLALVRSAFTAAKAQDRYLCAVMDTSFGLLERGTDAIVDGTVFAELASFGVDEILIKNTVIDESDIPADEIAAYLTGCAEITGGSCQLGILFTDDVFLEFSNAHAIQTIASVADFTGIDMTAYTSVTPDEMYDRMTQDIISLYGSFSIYNMRVVLSTTDLDLLAAQAQALRDSTITNLCFTENILPDLLSYSRHPVVEIQPDEEPRTAITPKALPQTNPYATTSSSSQTAEETPAEEVSGSAEDSTAVGNSWYVDENGNRIRPWY